MLWNIFGCQEDLEKEAVLMFSGRGPEMLNAT